MRFGNAGELIAILDQLHSDRALGRRITDAAHAGMLQTAKALAMTAIDIALEPGLIDRIKADFAAREEPEAAPFANALRRMLAFGKAAALLPEPERREAWRKLRRWMGIWTSREYGSPKAQKLATKAANFFIVKNHTMR